MCGALPTGGVRLHAATSPPRSTVVKRALVPGSTPAAAPAAIDIGALILHQKDVKDLQ